MNLLYFWVCPFISDQKQFSSEISDAATKGPFKKYVTRLERGEKGRSVTQFLQCWVHRKVGLKELTFDKGNTRLQGRVIFSQIFILNLRLFSLSFADDRIYGNFLKVLQLLSRFYIMFVFKIIYLCQEYMKTLLISKRLQDWDTSKRYCLCITMLSFRYPGGFYLDLSKNHFR